ncbi:isoprenyl transferase [Floccifex sp.]|uniref:isoprenyl transferase n=1 Tax=Floccifex sp. TaxID=2815810 RepID=UPI002A762F95|nr:isoprenyl transferase [Floccifex sp.]MDD7281986.1 isoprenyl transferase [Erysipelotrichaceae bacterium]MDY2958485.1 isoprenyl transferase [Floccifex sp.]
MKIPETVAIIMDGNGRWAKKRGLPRTAGHKKGADMIREIGLAANELGIKKLILYAFSTENWKRPEEEVGYLCKLPGLFFDRYMKELMENNIKVTFAGELDKFPQETQNVVNKAVEQSKNNTGLNLCLAINYGAQREITLGIKKYAQEVVDNKRANDLSESEFSKYLFVEEDIDLMIRTSGEQRLSNFLLWQVAYAEFIFTPVSWPEFDKQCLIDCIKEYNERDRRFGGIK